MSPQTNFVGFSYNLQLIFITLRQHVMNKTWVSKVKVDIRKDQNIVAYCQLLWSCPVCISVEHPMILKLA